MTNRSNFFYLERLPENLSAALDEDRQSVLGPFSSKFRGKNYALNLVVYIRLRSLVQVACLKVEYASKLIFLQVSLRPKEWLALETCNIY